MNWGKGRNEEYEVWREQRQWERMRDRDFLTSGFEWNTLSSFTLPEIRLSPLISPANSANFFPPFSSLSYIRFLPPLVQSVTTRFFFYGTSSFLFHAMNLAVGSFFQSPTGRETREFPHSLDSWNSKLGWNLCRSTWQMSQLIVSWSLQLIVTVQSSATSRPM